MVTRLSQLFVRTLREDPSDAEVASHRLLVRAGYIRRQAPGIFAWLPLGLKVRRKIEKVIREELEAFGAQEVHFPALLPREPYEVTNRWEEYGDGIFRLKDRKGADYLLAPTHEEVFTLLVKDLYSSYKDLPLNIYQIQDKYRDEARPRAGLLRGREFTMKDSVLVRLHRRGPGCVVPGAPRRLRADLPASGPRVRDRAGGCRGDGRLQERGVPAPDTHRGGHVRAVRPAATRPTSRPTARRCPRSLPFDGLPAAGDARLARTRRRSRPSSTSPTHEHPRADRPWTAAGHAEERRAGARPPRRHARTRDREPARRPRRGPQARRGRLRARGVEDGDRRGLRGEQGPGQGLHRPEGAGGFERHPFRRPPGRRRERSGSRVPTSTEKHVLRPRRGARLHGRRRHRDRGRPRRRPRSRRLRPDRGWRAAWRSGTCSSSAASTPRRSGCRCSTRTASSSR